MALKPPYEPIELAPLYEGPGVIVWLTHEFGGGKHEYRGNYSIEPSREGLLCVYGPPPTAEENGGVELTYGALVATYSPKGWLCAHYNNAVIYA